MLIIFFLISYLVSTTQLSQVLRLPILVEHFIEHTEKDHNLSLWHFLVLHYDHHEPDGDYETDRKLPFMTPSDMATIVVYFNDPYHFVIKNELIQGKEIFFHYEPNVQSSYLSAIWQPPKFC